MVCELAIVAILGVQYFLILYIIAPLAWQNPGWQTSWLMLQRTMNNNSEFQIKLVEWLGGGVEGDIDDLTFASISIDAGDHVATRVLDNLSKTVRDTIRVSAYELAAWLAFNWWRLRWETEGDDISWGMSHKISGTGGGYRWPDLTFASDGETVQVHSRQTGSRYKSQLINYISDFNIRVHADEFEMAIDGFIQAVVGRLRSSGAEIEGIKDDAEALIQLWEDVCSERSDPESATWRKLEAMMGCDPGEAPEDLMEMLQKASSSYGKAAIEELVAASRDIPLGNLEKLWDESSSQAIKIKIPGVNEIRNRVEEEQASYYVLPWQRATRVAATVRQMWEIEPGPLPSSVLLDRLNISKKRWGSRKGYSSVKASAGLRNGTDTDLSVFMYRKYDTGNRFDLARLVGDHIDTLASEERLLPSTKAKTARQKFQRVFAQELLCPFKDLQDSLSTDRPDEDDIERVAEEYGVSPRTVESTLVSKRVLPWGSVFES